MRPSWYVLWAIHPERGLVHTVDTIGWGTHPNWFEELGLPASGATFDKLHRGRLLVMPDWETVWLWAPNGGTPNYVWKKFRDMFNLGNFKIREDARAGERLFCEYENEVVRARLAKRRPPMRKS